MPCTQTTIPNDETYVRNGETFQMFMEFPLKTIVEIELDVGL